VPAPDRVIVAMTGASATPYAWRLSPGSRANQVVKGPTRTRARVPSTMDCSVHQEGRAAMLQSVGAFMARW